jgi:predicted KAP-like P-loop ATPase
MSKQKNTLDPAVSLIDGADAPIRSLSEDRLGRQSFAHALAAEVLAAPAARGYVMGLTGPWGSGKTSILNMTVDAIGDEAIVIHFNPWMFSGTEALVSSFFAEIGKQLDKKEAKLRGIASKLATYGQVLSPLAAVVGAAGAVHGATAILQALSAAPSVFDQYQELRTMLEELDKRLVVVVDDVDRLRPDEVLDIVRLVRLVGDFPNTLYLLAFDRRRIEECLGEGDPRGDARTSRRSSRSLTTCRLRGSRMSPRCSSRALSQCSTPCRPGRLTPATGKTYSRSSSARCS